MKYTKRDLIHVEKLILAIVTIWFSYEKYKELPKHLNRIHLIAIKSTLHWHVIAKNEINTIAKTDIKYFSNIFLSTPFINETITIFAAKWNRL